MSDRNSLFSNNTLRKLASSNVNKDTLSLLKKQLKKGATSIKKPEVSVIDTRDGSEAQEDISSRKRIRASLLRGMSARPGEHTSHKVQGKDSDQYSRREYGVGERQRRSEHEHKKVTPNSVTHSSSYEFSKVAAVAPQNKRRLKNMKADIDALPQYRALIAEEPVVLGADLNEIPMIAFPSNESMQVEMELRTIQDTMDNEPLLEDIMDLADEEPMELFVRACNALGVPVDEEIAPLLVQDLRRIAITLKYVHRRPRPVEIAPYHGYNVNPTHIDPYADTPSYPSVHALIGYGLANFYSEMYPQFEDNFYQVGDTIAIQRIQSGQHFPSDTEYSKVIADTLLKEKKRTKKKNTPKKRKIVVRK